MKESTTQRPILTLIFSAVLLAAGTTAIATTSKIIHKRPVFNILSEIYIDGVLVSSPRMITHANQKATIALSDKGNSNSLRMDLIANDDSNLGTNGAIKINFDVRYKSGKDSVHTKPQLIVIPKQTGVVSFTADSGHTYEMRVLAERE